MNTEQIINLLYLLGDDLITLSTAIEEDNLQDMVDFLGAFETYLDDLREARAYCADRLNSTKALSE